MVPLAYLLVGLILLGLLYLYRHSDNNTDLKAITTRLKESSDELKEAEQAATIKQERV